MRHKEVSCPRSRSPQSQDSNLGGLDPTCVLFHRMALKSRPGRGGNTFSVENLPSKVFSKYHAKAIQRWITVILKYPLGEKKEHFKANHVSLFSFTLLQWAGPSTHTGPASILQACGHTEARKAAGAASRQPPGAGGHAAGGAHSLINNRPPGQLLHQLLRPQPWQNRGRFLPSGSMKSREGTGVCASNISLIQHKPSQSRSKSYGSRGERARKASQRKGHLNWVMKGRGK